MRSTSRSLQNALRHGAGKPVVLRGASNEGGLRINVSDCGLEIRSANHAKLCQRFFTTERDSGGSWLGLSSVRTFAERQGGEVRFTTSAADTTFTLLLPYKHLGAISG